MDFIIEFDIRYQVRHAHKGQLVADFIIEFTLLDGGKRVVGIPIAPTNKTVTLETLPEQCNMFIDISLNRIGSGVNLLLITPDLKVQVFNI